VGNRNLSGSIQKGVAMVRTGILAAVVPLLVITGCHTNAPPQDATQEVIALECSALDRWSQGDPLGYLDIAADDVTWFDFTPGPELRSDGLEAVRNLLAPLASQIPPHTYELVDPKVQVYGDTAILTFHWSGTTTDGQPMGEWRATSVYHWKDDTWRMVHANWSAVQVE
jgi:ketosteroid isomerase-like protein